MAKKLHNNFIKFDRDFYYSDFKRLVVFNLLVHVSTRKLLPIENATNWRPNRDNPPPNMDFGRLIAETYHQQVMPGVTAGRITTFLSTDKYHTQKDFFLYLKSRTEQNSIQATYFLISNPTLQNGVAFRKYYIAKRVGNIQLSLLLE